MLFYCVWVALLAMELLAETPTGTMVWAWFLAYVMRVPSVLWVFMASIFFYMAIHGTLKGTVNSAFVCAVRVSVRVPKAVIARPRIVLRGLCAWAMVRPRSAVQGCLIVWAWATQSLEILWTWASWFTQGLGIVGASCWAWGCATPDVVVFLAAVLFVSLVLRGALLGLSRLPAVSAGRKHRILASYLWALWSLLPYLSYKTQVQRC